MWGGGGGDGYDGWMGGRTDGRTESRVGQDGGHGQVRQVGMGGRVETGGHERAARA